MNFIGRAQVLSSLAGVPKAETCPAAWERLQGVPMLEERQKWRARLKRLLGRPDSVPSGCGSWPKGRESCGWHCLLQIGWVLSVSLEGATAQAAALPAVLSFEPPEFCAGGQPVPKGGERASRHQHWGETETFLAISNMLQA